ncbi:MAG: copper homeostasis protein CutC [Runella slithyformis]|nr:MAG: copper homeostasis protein CutC [Runella slithyformis]
MEVEVCAFSIESCLNAQLAGATRVELCAGIYEGGTTPSCGMVALARACLAIELYVMIRPRGGDFCYDAHEFEVMKHDIETAKRLDADGVVLGILLPNGQIDVARSRELVELAKPLKTTFHRAFDRAAAPFGALESIIETGAVRLLTSGQQPTALAGKELLAQLIQQANGRIEIMAGSGVTAQNAVELAQTGVQALHLTGKTSRAGQMIFEGAPVGMASILSVNENEIIFSDIAKIKAVWQALA